jgi:cyclopropane-fatty-acyl-phospholipid synthase
MDVAGFLSLILGDDSPVRVVAYDGSSFGPPTSETTVRIVSPVALRRIVASRGAELGFTRAIIAGDIEVEGDVFGLFELQDRIASPTRRRQLLRPALDFLDIHGVRDLAKAGSPPPPREEIRLTGRLHSRARDAEAISSHYDVSNEFYDLILGRAMTYSCAVYETPSDALFTAQQNKHDLICRKLALKPGMRHLDIGCGWGSMVLHAAKHYGVRSVGVTISAQQAERARKRVADAGLIDQIEIRIQDYRDINDGPFDAISSIGMAEHVGGPEELSGYFAHVHALLSPNGRFLNHAIGRAAHVEPAGAGGFIQRYVFPDGELHELGASITAMQENGFEARHMETLRLHYARTLRAWVTNLENSWDQAIAEIGRGRAMVWRLYMAGSAVAFERGDIELHQVLAIPHTASAETIALRPDW